LLPSRRHAINPPLDAFAFTFDEDGGASEERGGTSPRGASGSNLPKAKRFLQMQVPYDSMRCLPIARLHGANSMCGLIVELHGAK
jgi:hypothetical protein